MNKAVAIASLFGLSSLSLLAACDDPVVVPADDGRVKPALSGGCRAIDGEPVAKGFQSQTKMTVKGIERSYDWLVPDAHDGRTPLPVVFVYGDAGSTGATTRTSFALEAATGGQAIMVYPELGTLSKSWDIDRGGESNADILFFDQVRTAITETYCVDTNRVFVAGVGNGAAFANNLGCIRGGSIRAVAAQSGSGPASTDYNERGSLACPEKPVAAIVISGTADATSLAQGQASRDHWARVNGCRSGGLEVFDPAPCRNQLNCARDRPVVWCEVPDLAANAVWSEAPRAAWKFFSQL